MTATEHHKKKKKSMVNNIKIPYCMLEKIFINRLRQPKSSRNFSSRKYACTRKL